MKDPKKNTTPMHQQRPIRQQELHVQMYMYHTKHDKWIIDKHVHLPLNVLTCANFRI